MNIAHVMAAGLFALASASAQSGIVGSLPLEGQPTLLRIDPTLHRGFYVDLASSNLVTLDLDGLKIAGKTSIDGTPKAVRVDAARHRVYVLHGGSPGSVTVVDGKTSVVMARITVGDDPVDLAANFQRSELYVSDYSSKRVSIIDTKAQAVAAAVPMGDTPTYMAVSTVSGKVYVTQPSQRAVVVIDPSTRSLVKTIAVPIDPRIVLIDDMARKLAVAGFAHGFTNHVDQMAVIDTDTDIVSSSGMGIDLATDQTKGTWQRPTQSTVYARSYFPNYLAGTVDIVGAGNSYVSKRVTVGGTPAMVVVNEDDGEVYVLDRASDTVNILDARLGKVAGTIKLGRGFPFEIARFGDRVAILGFDSGAVTLYVATAVHIQPSTAIASDYHHAAFDHYFHTASGDEAKVLDDGAFGEDWKRTQQYWRVWKTAGPGRVPVCRFFSTTFGAKSSHFYTPYGAECADLKAGNVWSYEDVAYYVALPDASGKCSPIYRELYRLYNNGMGEAPNHAYTPSRTVRDALAAKGWVPEGTGPDNVFACTPPLEGFVTSAP